MMINMTELSEISSLNALIIRMEKAQSAAETHHAFFISLFLLGLQLPHLEIEFQYQKY